MNPFLLEVLNFSNILHWVETCTCIFGVISILQAIYFYENSVTSDAHSKCIYLEGLHSIVVMLVLPMREGTTDNSWPSRPSPTISIRVKKGLQNILNLGTVIEIIQFQRTLKEESIYACSFQQFITLSTYQKHLSTLL